MVRFKSMPSYDALTVQQILVDEDKARPDALADDFSLRLIAKQLKQTKSAEDKGTAANKKEAAARDEKVAKDAKYLMWTWVGEQWYLLLLGFPFMFLASLSDLFVPDYTGRIVDAFMEENYEGPGGAFELLREWMLILLFGTACTFIQMSIFGLTGERLGNALRKRLFGSLINKDVEFYDENRTGDLISRISSDTQVVQEGLTTAVAQSVKELCKVAVVVVIICFYSWPMALLSAACLAPSIYVTRNALSWMMSSGSLV